ELGISPLRGLAMSRQVRPEFEAAQENLGVSGSRTRSVTEMQAIEQAKADERIRVAAAQAGLNLTRDQLRQLSDAYLRGGSIKADDPANIGNSNQIADALPEQIRRAYSE